MTKKTILFLALSSLLALCSTSQGQATAQDTTPPVLTLPKNVVVPVKPNEGGHGYREPSTNWVPLPLVTAQDDLDPNPTLTYNYKTAKFLEGWKIYLFPAGYDVPKTVTVTAKDKAGNVSTGTFTMTLTALDIYAPRLTLPANVTVSATDAAGAVVNYPAATAQDNLDPNPTITYSHPSGSTFPVGDTTVTVRAQDAAGNASSESFTVTVKFLDTVAPVLTLPKDTVVETPRIWFGTEDNPKWFVHSWVNVPFATAQDNLDPNPEITYESDRTMVLTWQKIYSVFIPVSVVSSSGTANITVTARDKAGNSSTGTFMMTLRVKADTEAPVLTLPANVTAAASSGAGAVVNYPAATAQDDYPWPRITYSHPSGSTFPVGTTTVTVTAKDFDGNTSSGTFVVSVEGDRIAPVLTLPANVTVAATSAAGAVVNYPAATAKDNVDPNPEIIYSRPSGSTFPVGTTTVTVAAKDSVGNVSSGTFTVTVRHNDTTPPVLTLPANVTVVIARNIPRPVYAEAVVNYPAATAKDNFDSNPRISYSHPSGWGFRVGSTTVKVTATDAAGNTSTGTFTVTVELDYQAPVLTLPANVTVDATSATGVVVNYPAATAKDNADPNPTIRYGHPSGSTFPVGLTTVWVTATDASGNTSSVGTFTVTVALDNQAPVLTLPANVTVDATSGPRAVVNYPAATAKDNLDSNPTISYSHASGSAFPAGTTTVTVTARDSAGNTSSGTFVVRVNPKPGLDTTPPVLTLPGDIVVERARQWNPWWPGMWSVDNGVTLSATAEDDADPNPVITYSSPAWEGWSGRTWDGRYVVPGVGATRSSSATITVTATARDISGNFSTGTFKVTLRAKADTEAPVLTLPSDVTVDAESSNGVVFNYPAATAKDDYPWPTITYSHPSGSTFPIGTTTVTVTAKDFDGNVSSGTFAVTVKGAEGVAPVLTLPANVTVVATSGAGAVVNYPAATAKDNADPNPTISYSHASGSTFPVGTTTVTVTAKDSSGNTSSGTFTVSVEADRVAPVLTLPANVTVDATSATGVVVNYPAATAKDNADPNPTITYSHPSGSTFSIGNTMVTVTARDASGNASSGSFTVTVKPSDTVAPVLTLPANVTLDATSAAGAVVNYPAATAKDDVDPNPAITYSHASGSTFPVGTTTVTVTAKDTAGNSTLGAFTVTVAAPRVVLDDVAGTYDGLLNAVVAPDVLSAQPGAAAVFERTRGRGLLTVTVTKAGAVSGRVSTGGLVQTFKGTVNNTGAVVFSEGLPKLALKKLVAGVTADLGELSLRVLAVQPAVVEADLTLPGGQLVLAEAEAEKHIYSAASVLPAGMVRVPEDVLNPSRENGAYTAIFGVGRSSEGLSPSKYPQAPGTGNLTVNADGTVRVVGRLADGSAVSYTQRLSPTRGLPVYIPLYSAKGYIAGRVQFDPSQEQSDANGGMEWVRPAGLGTGVFGAGWPQGLRVDFAASKYVPYDFKTTDDVSNAFSTTWTVTASGGGISQPIKTLAVLYPFELQTGFVKFNSLDTARGIYTAQQISMADGGFSGTFVHPRIAQPVTFEGVFFQKTGVAYGRFNALGTVGAISMRSGTPWEEPGY